MNTVIEVEYHPWGFFVPQGAKMLMLGSFPPPRARWSMEFYYPNLQNDMWRIAGLAFYGDRERFVRGKGFDEAAIRAFCAEKGLALGDTARAARRLSGNASDKDLEIVETVDVAELLRNMPACRHLVTTGQKATDALTEQIGTEGPRVGECAVFALDDRVMRLWRMPSSSRAYPLPLQQKVAAYEAMFRAAGMLP
ncbi:MAG: uracil-DNA glycosylase family protein [Rikenellaceae bacterium]|jgi:G:T/U-mismatch repair DNA glycosylase|nr:uracil-DNA glycosylase family protein [Rikenellaceae bacterium]